MKKKFGTPTRNRSQSTGTAGEVFVNYFVTKELDWIFRPVNREHDFGIDGYIDTVDGTSVTGLGLAVQVKCGNSYLKRTPGGLKYKGDRKHLNYYLNLSVPVILIIVNDDHTEAYWVEFDIEKTLPSGKGWWIEIPYRNRLDNGVKEKWRTMAGVLQDFSEKVDDFWGGSETFEKWDMYVIAIPKSEIEGLSFETINRVFGRLSLNTELLVRKRNTVEIFFPDYDDDEREIYQIPEIRSWFVRSVEEGVPWFYFLNTRPPIGGLIICVTCGSDIERTRFNPERREFLIRPEMTSLQNYINRNVTNLHAFVTHHSLPEKIIKKVSSDVSNRLKIIFREASGQGKGPLP